MRFGNITAGLRRPGTMQRFLACLFLTANLCGCAAKPQPCPPDTPAKNVVYLVKHGWHTDIAVPSDELRGNMTVFQQIFPGLKILLIGFGKRTFMTAPVQNFGDMVIGPFPGDGVALIVGLSATPNIAYNDGGTIATLTLPPGGAERLSDFIWSTLKTANGAPVELRPGFFPGSIFYLTNTRYAGTNTCNTWTADALQAAGLKIHPAGDIFSWQTMSQAEHLTRETCSIKDDP